MDLVSLPNEIILKIFSYLSFPHLLPSISVCKQLLQLLTRDDIWLSIARNSFGIYLLYKRNLSWYTAVTDEMRTRNYHKKQGENRKKRKNIIKWIKQNIKTNLSQNLPTKVILLGTGESGKATFFKHIKLYYDGASEEELLTFKSIVHGNLVTDIRALINAVYKIFQQFETPDMDVIAKRVLALSTDSWSEMIADDIGQLWESSSIKRALLYKDSEYQLNDAAPYFLNQLDRIRKEDYVPTHQDVLYARIRTTGLEESQYDAGEDLATISVVLTGGQRSERKKWIHCFDNTSAVVFFVSLSEYNQTLREDSNTNRMKESLIVFDEVIHSYVFTKVPFHLVFTKTDVFAEKIMKFGIKNSFLEYSGIKDRDVTAATSYIMNKFLTVNRTQNLIFVHFTCTVHPTNFLCTWSAILQQIKDHLFPNRNVETKERRSWSLELKKKSLSLTRERGKRAYSLTEKEKVRPPKDPEEK